MSDVHDLGAELSPEEQGYFDNGGEGTIPEGDKGAGGEGEGTGDTEGTQKTDAEKAGEGEKGGDKIEKMVSLAALHEERAKRKQIDTEHRKTQQELAELRGKFAILDKFTGPKEQPAPTVETDIFGVAKNLEGSVAEIKKQLADQAEANAQAHEFNTVVGHYQRDAARFKSANADFDDAYNHLVKSRAEELISIGYDDPAEIGKAISDDEFVIAQRAMRTGKSPAEIIYALAKQRGYMKVVGDGKAGKGAEKLETIRNGQQSNKSFSSTGGGSGDVDMTAEALLKMPNDEFEAWCTKNPKRAQRLMGG
jgi:hypothetical protein